MSFTLPRPVLSGLLLLTALFAYSLATAQEKKYPSLLWEINGNGLQESSYLYGTMHVSKKVAFNLGEPFFDALKEVDQVALEMDPEKWFVEILGGDALSQIYRSGLRSAYNGEHNPFVDRYKLQVGWDQRVFSSLQQSPQQINQLLFRFQDPTGNFEEDTWLDMYIYQIAQKLGKRTSGLETFEHSMKLLQKASVEGLKEQMDVRLDYQEQLDIQREIEDSYRAGDLDKLDSLNSIVSTKSFIKYILLQRNEEFVLKMDSLMKVGSLFAGMGAAHLPGEEGCIELLREMGYTVTPLDRSGRNTKQKDKMQELIVDRKLTSYTTDDGRISFKTPFEAFSLSNDPHSTGYITMDIANGLTFVVDRHITESAVIGMTVADQIKRFEELKYEAVPGDIVKEKIITIDGFKGYDILHKNGRGDYLRSMILFSAQELMVVRLGGSGEKIKNGGGDYFFEDLRLSAVAPKLNQKIAGPYDAFHVTMQGEAVMCYEDESSSLDDLFIQSMDSDEDVFQLYRLTVERANYFEDDRYLLEQAAKAFAKDQDLKETLSAPARMDGRMTLDAQYEAQNGRALQIRFVLDADRVFALIARSNNEQKVQNHFSSLDFQKAAYGDESFPFTDSLAFISTSLNWEKEESALAKSLSSMYRSAYGGLDQYSPQDYEYSAYITPPKSGEDVSIHYYRYSRYVEFENKDSLRDRLEVSVAENGDFVIDESKYTDTENGFVVDYVLGDSLTSIKQYLHVEMDQSRMVSFRTMGEMLTGPSELYQKVVNDYSMLDDSLLVDFYSSPSKRLIEDLMSTDSAYYDLAKGYMEMLYMLEDEQQFEVLSAVMENAPPLADEDEIKEYTTDFNALRYLDPSPKMQQLLLDEYDAYPDSAVYQQSILANLMRMGDKSAFLKGKELLISRPPIGESIGYYDDLFKAMKDSLEFTALLYPEILELLDLDEYKDVVIHLTALAVDSGAIAPSAYSSRMKYILRNASLESQRAKSSEYNFGSGSYGNVKAKIKDYWNLLYPLRKKTEVATIFKSIETAKSSEARRALTHFYHSKDQEASSAEIASMTDDLEPMENWRFLEKIERLDLLPDTFDLDKEYIRMLVENDWAEYKQEWKEVEVDSITFFETRRDSIRTHGFDTYILRSKKTENEEDTWMISVVLINDHDEDQEPFYMYTTQEQEEEDVEDIEEQVEKLRELALGQNRRYPFYSTDDYSDEYDY